MDSPSARASPSATSASGSSSRPLPGCSRVTADSRDGTTNEREYAMPAAHRPVLVDATDASHVAPVADMVAGIGGVLDDLPVAYRSGGGMPYERYGGSSATARAA